MASRASPSPPTLEMVMLAGEVGFVGFCRRAERADVMVDKPACGGSRGREGVTRPNLGSSLLAYLICSSKDQGEGSGPPDTATPTTPSRPMSRNRLLPCSLALARMIGCSSIARSNPFTRKDNSVVFGRAMSGRALRAWLAGMSLAR